MSFNTFGHLFRVTTFGESHGPAIGCVVDGCPPGIALAAAEIQTFLDRRRPGQSRFTSQRREPDTVSILSGVVLAAVAPVLILRTHGWVVRACAGIFLLAFVGMSVSMTPAGGQVLRSLDLRFLDEDRAYARFEGYDVGLAELVKNPLTGYGAGSAGDGLDSYFEGSVYLPASHNVLLKIGFELGLIGLLAFLLFCIYWIRIATHRYRDATSTAEKALIGLAGCLFIVFVIQGASGSGIDTFPANGITFFLMGLIAGLKEPCQSI